MALGVDLFARYQNVTNWGAVRGAGVGYVWVKLTDGGGRATNPGDGLVAGAKSVGIPVGGYHFAQLSPSPEKQADVFIGEVRRLGATGLVPVLDLESPFSANGFARDFGIRFCRAVQAQGFRPGVYMNDSFAGALRPDLWGIDGLCIWIARYGSRPQYGGRYDVHQYSSSGSIPGIQASGVDLNESYTNNHFNSAPAPKPSGDDMAAIPYPYPACDRDAAGNLIERQHCFTLPVGAVSSVVAEAWLSFKCMNADGVAEYVRLQSVRGDDAAWMPGGTYPETKEWSNVPADHTRVFVKAADGQDSFVAYVRCDRPYSLCVETKAK